MIFGELYWAWLGMGAVVRCANDVDVEDWSIAYA